MEVELLFGKEAERSDHGETHHLQHHSNSAVGSVGCSGKDVFYKAWALAICSCLHRVLGYHRCCSFFSFGQSIRHFDTTGIILAASAGALGGLALVFFKKAVSSGPVSTVTAISALYPVIAIIFGVVFLKENLSATNATGIIPAVVAGVFISV